MKKEVNILVLCTGNTCRSQMTEGFFRYYFPHWKIFSAGTKAEEKINPLAVEVMRERGIDISSQVPEPVDKYLNRSFDIVLTVCDEANEICPVFTGDVRYRLHRGFEDPAQATGTYDEKIRVYRRIRDEIENFVKNFTNPIE